MGLQLSHGPSIQSPRRTAVAHIFQQRLRAGLAQLVEHLICNQGVAGSNPAAGTNKINYLGKSEIALSLFLVSPLMVSKARFFIGSTLSGSSLGRGHGCELVDLTVFVEPEGCCFVKVPYPSKPTFHLY